MIKNSLRTLLAVAAFALSGSAFAGPFILAGTDADDHGSTDGVKNLDGWFFMQRAFENIAPGVTNGNKTLVSLGSGGFALEAAQSAFEKSALASNGWSFLNIDGAANITNFLASGASGAGIIVLDSSSNNVSGGLQSDEEAALTANANALNTFLGQGGGLFSQANSYDWLNAIIPTVVTVDESETGINLTGNGSAAFPGLTASDLSSGPYHLAFQNYGAVPVLGVGTFTGSAIIIGANGGSITDPTQVPEPASLALLLGGAGLLGAARRKQKRS